MPEIQALHLPEAHNVAETMEQSVKSHDHGVLVWSSNDEDGLMRTQVNLSATLCRPGGSSAKGLEDIAYTLAKRTQHTWRRFVTYTTAGELQDKLNIPKGSPSALPKVKSTPNHKCALVFTGQGAQYAGMGLGLKATYAVFRESMERNQELLDLMGCEWQLDDLISSPDSPEAQRINEPQYSQPACTALQLALVDLMWSFGIQPTAVVGHSSGEIAAA